jgi:hypothetical protein
MLPNKGRAQLKVSAMSPLGFLLIVVGIISCTTPAETHFPERIFSGPWSMSTQDLERLRKNVDQIALDDDISHVVDVLGVPDLDYTVKKNDKNRFLTYYVTRQRADSSIESDKRVTVALNGQNKVKAIFSNVENIRTRNWP